MRKRKRNDYSPAGSNCSSPIMLWRRTWIWTSWESRSDAQPVFSGDANHITVLRMYYWLDARVHASAKIDSGIPRLKLGKRSPSIIMKTPVTDLISVLPSIQPETSSAARDLLSAVAFFVQILSKWIGYHAEPNSNEIESGQVWYGSAQFNWYWPANLLVKFKIPFSDCVINLHRKYSIWSTQARVQQSISSLRISPSSRTRMGSWRRMRIAGEGKVYDCDLGISKSV